MRRAPNIPHAYSSAIDTRTKYFSLVNVPQLVHLASEIFLIGHPIKIGGFLNKKFLAGGKKTAVFELVSLHAEFFEFSHPITLIKTGAYNSVMHA